MSKPKLIVLLIVIVMLCSEMGMISGLNVHKSEISSTQVSSNAATSTFYITGTFVINEHTIDPLTGTHGYYGFDTNVVVSVTGKLIVSNAIVYFLEDKLHPINLIVYGTLILDNATLTVVPSRLYPALYFTLNVDNSYATVLFKNSKLLYPGWFNVSNDMSGNIHITNTVFDKVSAQNLSLLQHYGFTGDINAVNDGPTPYFYKTILYLTNVSFSHLFDYSHGTIQTFATDIEGTMKYPITIRAGTGTTYIAKNFNSLIPQYPHDLTLTNATLDIVFSTSANYDNSSYVYVKINNSAATIPTIQLHATANLQANEHGLFSSNSISFTGANTVPVSLNFLHTLNALSVAVSAPDKGSITIKNVYLNLSTDKNLLKFGFYRYNFNLIDSQLYGQNVYISANYNINTGNPMYNGIYLNSSIAYILNLTVTNSNVKYDPPYIIDPTSTLYIYRYANLKIQNFDGTALKGAIISTYSTYPTSFSKTINILNAEILKYLNYDAPYNTTNTHGMVSIPLLSDIITSLYWPNSQYVGTYNFTVWASNYAKTLTSFSASLSYFPQLTILSNTMHRTVTVTVPNIIVTQLQTSAKFVHAHTYTLRATVMVYGSNIPNVPVKFTVSSGTSVYFTSTKYANLVQNRSNTVSTTWHVPDSVPVGNYTVSVIVNPANTIFESNYTDNQRSVIVPVYPNIDLSISKPVVSTPELYQYVTVSYNIANIGTELASNVKVKETVLYPDGTVYVHYINLSIPGGKKVSEKFEFNSNVAGTYVLKVAAEYYWDFNQLNNVNTTSLVFGIDYFPVLLQYRVISNISSYNNIMTLNLSVTVGVHGANLSRVPSVSVSFFDRANGYLIGTANTQIIHGKLVAYLVTNYFLYGYKYQIEVIVNPQSQVAELNYNNNFLNTSITMPVFNIYSNIQSNSIVNGTTDNIYVNSTVSMVSADNVTISLVLTQYPFLVFKKYYPSLSPGQAQHVVFVINTSNLPDIMHNQTSIKLHYLVLLTYSKLDGYYYIVKNAYLTVLEKPMLTLSTVKIITTKYITNTQKIAQGLTIDLFVNIYNIGGSTAYGNIILNITIDSSTIYHKVVISNLRPGHNISIIKPYLAAVLGTHTIIVSIEYKGVQKSTIYNQAKLNFTVIAPAIKLVVLTTSQIKTAPYQKLTLIVYALNLNATAQQHHHIYVANVLITVYAGTIKLQAHTNANGLALLKYSIPKPGTYPLKVTYSYDGYTSTPRQYSTLIVTTPPLHIPVLWIIIVIIIAVVGGFFGYTYVTYRKQSKNLMVCGNCGSLIPADVTKCPVCGVSFEPDKVKCSECGAWIDPDAKYCNNCGAVFVSKGDKEYEYLTSMKARYDEFLAKYKEEAKRDLGEDYKPEEFARWWQNRPEYVSFDMWTAQKEEVKKAVIKCPVCGALNTRADRVCRVCGAPLVQAKEVVQEEKPAAPPSPKPSAPPVKVPEQPTKKEREQKRPVVKRRIIKRVIIGGKEHKKEKQSKEKK